MWGGCIGRMMILLSTVKLKEMDQLFGENNEFSSGLFCT